MNLPKDPMMLYSFINMKLRDTYPSLDAFCDDFGVDRVWLEETLRAVGFEYQPETNSFY